MLKYTAAAAAAANNVNKKAIFNNRAPFTDCINKQYSKVHNTEDIDEVMSM